MPSAALLLAAAAGGCAGGQTGDVGTSDPGCTVVEERSATAADLAGFPVEPSLSSALGSSAGFEAEMMLALPPEIWRARGLSYRVLEPYVRADVSVVPTRAATLLVHDSGKSRAPGASVDCRDMLRVELRADVRLLEQDGVFGGTGSILIGADGAVQAPRLSFDALAEDCRFSSQGSETLELECGSGALAVYGSQRCLDPRDWQPPALEPRTGSTVSELLQHPDIALVQTLDCQSDDAVNSAELAQPIDVRITPRVAERSCYPFPLRAAVDIDWGARTQEQDTPALVDLSEAPCLPDRCVGLQECEGADLAGRCTQLVLRAEANQDRMLNLILQLDDRDRRVLGIEYWGPVGVSWSNLDSAGRRSCHGQRVLE